MAESVKNKHIQVVGGVTTPHKMFIVNIDCTITNDKIGKTLSLSFGDMQLTVPFEPLEEYLIDKK